MQKYTHMPEIDHESQNLRRSAIQQAVEISPYVHETTIGPKKSSLDPRTSADVKNLRPTLPMKADDVKTRKRKAVLGEAWQNELLFETKCGNLSLGKVLHECQLERKEAFRIRLKNMVSEIVSGQDEIRDKLRIQRELEDESRAREQRIREMEIQELAAGDKLAELQQKKMNSDSLLYAERHAELSRLVEQFDKNHSRLTALHVEVTKILSTDKTISSKNRQKYESTIAIILSSMHNITENFKSGIFKADIQKTEELVAQMKSLKTVILEDIDNTYLVNKAIQEAAIASNSTHSKQSNETVISDNVSPEKPKPTPIVQNKVIYFSKKSHDLYIQSKEYLENYECSYKNLLADVSQKNFRFELQKAVNTPLNTISSVSRSHLKDKYDKLSQLLSGERIKIHKDYISANQHPEGKAFCMNLLARKIVQQGDLTVSSNPEAAYPIATVTIALCARFPELMKLLNAHFYRECPYLIPMLIPQHNGQSDEDFYKARGYRYNEDGVIEKQDKFIKRMSGIFQLHSAIWISSLPSSVNAPHPQGLSHAWRWLAAFTNLEPEMEISATLIFDFLTVCGSECFKYYKRQFAKVLQLLMTEYYDKMQKIDEGGPKTRLGVFMQKIAKDGNIPPPPKSLGYAW